MFCLDPVEHKSSELHDEIELEILPIFWSFQLRREEKENVKKEEKDRKGKSKSERMQTAFVAQNH